MEESTCASTIDNHVDYHGEEASFDFDWIHESMKRQHLESATISNPSSEFDHVRRMISSWRNYDICIVFGNLGRQPYLLDYFLDLCFGHEEDLNVYCQYKLPSPYYTKDYYKRSDFLFFVEPPFGYTTFKPSNVKHLIVLTSHLALFIPNPNKNFYFLHLSNNKKQPLLTPNLEEGAIFKPPIFHEKVNIDIPKGAIVLDILKSKSAAEAYLRLLTGKELIGKKPYKILMSEHVQTILKTVLLVTGKRMNKLSEIEWIKNFYCNI